ncbi:M28 family metallopeptidase [uncultured Clostridium sp.]|uniref:M28 family metallopeptidase n=1 Tax=uncultured Clostridium sp. TaxID=59620 RepID=UPI0025EE89A8|nr:M28 family metallopeptidase [uncultured Clostridium sp.]
MLCSVIKYGNKIINHHRESSIYESMEKCRLMDNSLLCDDIILNSTASEVSVFNEFKPHALPSIFKFKEGKVYSTKEIVEKLCSDEYAQRLVGSKGNEKSAEYLSGILKEMNLEPVIGKRYCVPYTQWVYPKYNVIDDENCQYKSVNNIAGMIKGSDSTKGVVISAHFDNIGSRKDEGRMKRGALDNASGVAAVVKTAEILKDKGDKRNYARDIIFVFFNGEETDFQGSSAFVKKIKGRYSNIYNINIDCVGGKNAGSITLNNTSARSDKLTEDMKKCFKYNRLSYSDVPLKGGNSDSLSFEKAGISNIYISQDNIYKYIHNNSDNPENINFNDIDKLAEVIADFIINNDKTDF